MSPLIENLLISLVAAIVGALVVPLIEYLARAKQNKKYSSELVGTWKSSYITEDSGSWVDEEAEVFVRRSHFVISGRHNQEGVSYVAIAELINAELVGKWQLTSGNMSGNFLLAIRPHGGLLYGYYTGSRTTGERVFSAWVLGKSADDLRLGRSLLKNQTMKIEEG